MDAVKEVRTVRAEDGLRIEFDHYKAGHEKLVVIAHGFYNSKESLLLQDLGQSLLDSCDVAIMDFRGHGKSGGLFHWASKEPMDLEAVLGCLRPDYHRIAVIGFSFGAGIGMIVAGTTDLMDNLVFVSGPSEFKKIDFRWWELDVDNDIMFNLGPGGRGKGVRPGPFWHPKIQPIDIVEKLSVPVCYIHGDADWTIKPWHAQALYEKTPARKSLKIIHGGPHAEYLMRKHKEQFVGEIKAWLDQTF